MRPYAMKLVDSILESHGEMVAIRHDIHAHPELRYQEHRTAKLVADSLRSWGIDVTAGVGGTGVVGTLRNGTSTRSIGLRADMDALPFTEQNTFAHRSRYPGRMHACGHDGHTTILLAAARHLARHRTFDGTVHLIFQPAEEGGAGARTMIEDGLFEHFPCDAVFGLHNWPGLKTGQIGLCSGPLMASSNLIDIAINGRGAHAAQPDQGVDPVIVASHLALALQTIVSRNVRPIDTAVVSITRIHAGDAYNVIADTASLSGTVRTFSLDVLDLIEQRMTELVDTLPRAFGATATLKFLRNYPPLVNHPAEAAFCREVAHDVVGADNCIEMEPTMTAEDFAFMLQARPGCYFMLGNGDGAHRKIGHGLGPCQLHNASYDFNDELIPIGASFWVRAVEKWLPATA